VFLGVLFQLTCGLFQIPCSQMDFMNAIFLDQINRYILGEGCTSDQYGSLHDLLWFQQIQI